MNTHRAIIFILIAVLLYIVATINYSVNGEHEVGTTGKYSIWRDIGGEKCRKETLIKLKKGQNSVNDGNLDNALEVFIEANKSEPKCLGAIMNIALVYYYLKDYEKSEYMYREGLRLYPNNEYIIQSLGVVYTKYVGIEEGIKYHEKALKINQNMPLSHWALGNLYFALGNYSKAKTHLATYIEMSPDSIYVEEAKKRLKHISIIYKNRRNL
jgi:tetratricopeptide (TPR) repeat protein